MGAVLSTIPTRFLVWIDYGGYHWSCDNLGKQSDFERRLRTGLILGCCWTPVPQRHGVIMHVNKIASELDYWWQEWRSNHWWIRQEVLSLISRETVKGQENE